MAYAQTTSGMLKAQWGIILALMLHDIRSRFGGNAAGFFAMGVCWPLSHIIICMLLYASVGRVAPYGDSTALWFATGLVPFLAFQYIARFIVMGVVTNKSLLSFPVVKVTDLLFAAALIEVLNAGLVILFIFAIFTALDIDFMPRDVVQASLALFSMMFLGLAWGVLNAMLAGAFRLWILPFILTQILLWISSGVMFVPDAMPEVIRTPLSYLPTVQGLEWMRSAYYEGYGSAMLDKSYLLYFSVVTLFIGLVLERLIRGKIMSA